MVKLLISIAVIVVLGVGFWFLNGDQGPQTSPTPEPSASLSPTPVVTKTPTRTPAPTSLPKATKTPTPSAQPAPQQHTVNIQNFAFVSANLTVKKGDTVRFVNLDTAVHTSTAVNGSWDSGNLNAGASFTLNTSSMAPGVYQYRCTPHPFMTGNLTVQ